MKISVYKQSSYPISSAKIKTRLAQVLTREGLTSDFTVSVALVGEKKMQALVDKYYKDDPEGAYIHPILTFPTNEVTAEFVTPEGVVPDLGEIIISYPEAVNESKDSGRLIDEIVLSLVEHGAMHLLGKHHD